jgi:4-hydroxymandelate oxidase
MQPKIRRAMNAMAQEDTTMQPINLLEYEELARQRMAHIPWAWDYYQGGSEDEVSLHANRTAFEHIRVRPRMLVNVRTCDLRTSVQGTAVSMPILVAPTAGHGLAHPEGECATARAVRARLTHSWS